MELLSENDIEGIEAGEDYGEEELDTVVIMLNICQIYKVHVKLSTPIQLISDALFLMKLEKILTISPINSLKFRKEKSNLPWDFNFPLQSQQENPYGAAETANKILKKEFSDGNGDGVLFFSLPFDKVEKQKLKGVRIKVVNVDYVASKYSNIVNFKKKELSVWVLYSLYLGT